jgi:hypothetical protein
MPVEGVVVQVPKKGLAGPFAGLMRARWKTYRAELEATDRANRQQHGGRAPDFGDPMVALGGVGAIVEGLAGALETSKQAKLVVTPLDERLEAKLELETEPGGKAASALAQMPVGDLAPLLALPKGMDLAIFNRTTREGREESAKTLADGIARLFGDRIGAGDKKKLEQVVNDLAVGRGDEASYGLLSTSERMALVFRGKVADEKRFESGIKGALDLLKLRALAEPVKQFAGEVSLKHGSVEVPGIDAKVQRATLTLKPTAMPPPGAPKDATPTTRTFELLWFIKDGDGYAALSTEAQPVLAQLVTTSAASSLDSDALTKAAAKRVGSNASFTLFAQPLDLGMGSMKSSAPLVIALGKNGTNGWLRADADRAAVRGLVQRFMKF